MFEDRSSLVAWHNRGTGLSLMTGGGQHPKWPARRQNAPPKVVWGASAYRSS